MRIIKRDGRVVEFELAKLISVIEKAGAGTLEYDKQEAERLAEIVVGLIPATTSPTSPAATLGTPVIPSVEQVQDIVEQVLMAAGHYKTAKAYILYREKTI